MMKRKNPVGKLTEQQRIRIRRLVGECSTKDPSGCWLWNRYVRPNGYGQMGRRERAHVMSYRAFHGEVEDGQVVRHSCDVRHCVNPDHLESGTQRQNLVDRQLRRGRLNKLTPDHVVAIRAQLSSGGSQGEVARSFGISQAMVSKIARRQDWAYV